MLQQKLSYGKDESTETVHIRTMSLTAWGRYTSAESNVEDVIVREVSGQ